MFSRRPIGTPFKRLNSRAEEFRQRDATDWEEAIGRQYYKWHTHTKRERERERERRNCVARFSFSFSARPASLVVVVVGKHLKEEQVFLRTRDATR